MPNLVSSLRLEVSGEDVIRALDISLLLLKDLRNTVCYQSILPLVEFLVFARPTKSQTCLDSLHAENAVKN